jgi:hypothetical protein
MMVKCRLFFVCFLFISSIHAMNKISSPDIVNKRDYVFPIQHGQHVNQIVSFICGLPNDSQPFWPLLLYPKDGEDKNPEKNKDDKLVFFYWKKFEKIEQFSSCLDQLIATSKQHTPHSDWNSCFEKIYTEINSLMKLMSQIITILKDNPNKGTMLVNQKKFLKLTSIDSNSFSFDDLKRFLEKQFFVPYNYFVIHTGKSPNESIDDFNGRINTVFNGELKEIINNLNVVKEDIERKIEADEFLENIKSSLKQAMMMAVKILLPLSLIALLIVVYKKSYINIDVSH